jgi:signal peptidase
VSTLVVSNASRRPTRRILLAVATMLAWGVFGFAVTVGAVVSVPRAIGMQAFAILSGSMEPTLAVGDLVVNRTISADEIRLGDIITFRDPEASTRLLTHRVVDYRVYAASVDVVTRGDANATAERWSIPADGRLGRVEFRLPRVGYAVMHGAGRTGRILLVLLPVVALALLELKRIWFPKERGRG